MHAELTCDAALPHLPLQVYKQVFPFYCQDQFERELARLQRQLDAVRAVIVHHIAGDAAAKSAGEESMRRLQHRLMQKAEAVRVMPQ